MGLFDFRGRPVAPVAPAVDEIRLANLVATRCAAWRHEPTGIPRSPDLVFFRRQFGREPSAEELGRIKRLWSDQRRTNGVGGAIGITTHDQPPSDDLLSMADAAARRFGK
ncbi:MAG: hypothetical protein ACHQWU_12250 [Gemmatimonadales bacterium]